MTQKIENACLADRAKSIMTLLTQVGMHLIARSLHLRTLENVSCEEGLRQLKLFHEVNRLGASRKKFRAYAMIVMASVLIFKSC